MPTAIPATPPVTETAPAAMPDAPAPPSPAPPPEDSAPDAAEAAAAAPAQDAPAATAPAPRDVLKGLSPQERADALREMDWQEVFEASDWLKGKVGAQKQRTTREQAAERDRIAAEIRQEIAAETEAERLRAAIEADDPFRTHELVKQQHATKTERAQAERAQAQAEARVGEHAQSVLGAAALAAVQDLPEPLRARVLFDADGTTPRRYAPDGTVAEGLAAFVAEVAAARAELLAQERLSTERPKLRKEIEAAVKKELNGEAIGDEPVPDTGSGSAAPRRGPMDQAEWNGIRSDPDLRRDPANRDRFRAGKDAGLITY